MLISWEGTIPDHHWYQEHAVFNHFSYIFIPPLSKFSCCCIFGFCSIVCPEAVFTFRTILQLGACCQWRTWLARLVEDQGECWCFYVWCCFTMWVLTEMSQIASQALRNSGNVPWYVRHASLDLGGMTMIGHQWQLWSSKSCEKRNSFWRDYEPSIKKTKCWGTVRAHWLEKLTWPYSQSGGRP